MTAQGEVRWFTGVWNTDAGLRGEVAFALGRLRGTAHCALSEITHDGRHRNPEWDALVATFEVPFEVVHRNERSADVTKITEGQAPCVVAHTEDRLVVVLSPEDLDRIGPHVLRFDQVLRDALTAEGLSLPAA